MIVFNFTGLPRMYWLPYARRDKDLLGLPYVTLRWLNVEVVVYSVAAATRFIYRHNAFVAAQAKEQS